jgi:hypothetical protein
MAQIRASKPASHPWRHDRCSRWEIRNAGTKYYFRWKADRLARRNGGYLIKHRAHRVQMRQFVKCSYEKYELYFVVTISTDERRSVMKENIPQVFQTLFCCCCIYSKINISAMYTHTHTRTVYNTPPSQTNPFT